MVLSRLADSFASRALALTLSLMLAVAASLAKNQTFANPMLPGYHPDPSCIRVQDTFYCVTSSFVTFPGLPIYASKDLQNWRLVSHAFNRVEQMPTFNKINSSQTGIQAPTLRHNNGTFYIITTVLGEADIGNVILSTSNPCDDSAWSNARKVGVTTYDPDMFFDRDGKVYSHSALMSPQDRGILQARLDVHSGKIGPITRPWNGSGDIFPEGPHMYFKDGFYYIMNAEGGTDRGHMEVIARSRAIDGPYVADPANPILTNRNTSQYFQGVGHADLFQDVDGNWWGVALAKRSGQSYKYFPMNRETSLFAVTWERGAFPVLDQVRGRMQGPLPKVDKNLLCGDEATWILDDDAYDFAPGTRLPKQLAFYGIPNDSSYQVSPKDRPNSLQLIPPVNSLPVALGMTTFIGRRQMHTLFEFSATIEVQSQSVGDEAGLSVFLDTQRRIDLGVVTAERGERKVRLTTLAADDKGITDGARIVSERLVSKEASLHLVIEAVNQTHYSFAAKEVPADGVPDSQMTADILGFATSDIVSFGFTGCFVGAYAKGDNHSRALISRWRYTSKKQILS